MANTYTGASSPAPEDFDGWSDDEIGEAMIEWFQHNFEDPAMNTPHESSEGGYQYVWGGPYDATEEISGSFPEVDEALIKKAVDIVEREGTFDWAPSNRTYEEDVASFEDEDAELYFAKFKESAATLRDVAAEMPFQPSGIGHNHPPEAIEGGPLDEQDQFTLIEASETIVALGETDPNTPEIAEAAVSKILSIRDKLFQWLAQKVGLAVDEFIKSFAAEAGKWTARIGGVWVLGKALQDVIETYHVWAELLLP